MTLRKHKIFKSTKVIRSLTNVILPECNKVVNIGTRKHRKEYLRIYCGYDCETTTVRTPDGWRSAVYIHQLAIAADLDICYIYLLRTWDEILSLFAQIRDYYRLSQERSIIIWDANLGFEFSFLQHRFKWDHVFAKEPREPLLAASGGLEFRECLTISGGGLAYLAKTYCYTTKLENDLDYKKLRNTSDYLDETELAYCINDVLILAEFSYIMFKDEITPKHRIPMTKTSILIGDIQKRFEHLSKRLDPYKLHKQAYLDLHREAFPDELTYYAWFKYLFRGGYVHANALYVGADLPRVAMWDITSSYPAEITLGYCPVSPFKEEPFSKAALKSKCCWICARIYSIRIKTHHTIESENKIRNSVNAKFDNGRLIKADIIEVMLTELDLEVYEWFYQWDRMEITYFATAKRGKFPSFVRENMLAAYKEKQRLKKEGLGKTPDYAIQKAYVNSHFGALVKRIRIDTITYDNEKGWIQEEKQKDYAKEAEKTILFPQHGIWCTSLARHSLLSIVKKLDSAGIDVVYCDTDSVKYVLKDEKDRRGEKIILKYNRRRAKQLKKRRQRSEFVQGLGEFSFEGTVRFKTLGAKRYLTFDGKEVEATVAGLPKQSISALGSSPDEIFAAFSETGFKLTPEQADKLTTSYTDKPYDLYINGEWMHEESGVALYDIPFKIKQNDIKESFLRLAFEHSRVGFMV